ncbi:hypothetical protein PR048_016398 [Dryococelus australis]|uniref:Uncharacterized protein n=1 Tax=Dryococelus australis TaxID=614101 RepID=A0ABQ9HK53_9NEOP|nr:hypothetical protein PR048_016398 [Dryococelus australis]
MQLCSEELLPRGFERNIPIHGGFYAEATLPTMFGDVYLVEKVLKRRNGRSYVQLWSFPTISGSTMWTSNAPVYLIVSLTSSPANWGFPQRTAANQTERTITPSLWFYEHSFWTTIDVRILQNVFSTTYIVYPPTKANMVRFPAVSLPDFRIREIVPDDASDRRVFSGISRFNHPFVTAPLHAKPRFNLIGTQDIA